MTDLDKEDTVRIRKSDTYPRGVFSSDTPVSCLPDPTPAHNAVEQLDRNWRNEVANLKQELEALRSQVQTLREENNALRETLSKVRGR